MVLGYLLTWGFNQHCIFSYRLIGLRLLVFATPFEAFGHGFCIYMNYIRGLI